MIRGKEVPRRRSSIQSHSMISKSSNVSRIEDVSLFTESINVIVRCRGRGYMDDEQNSPNVVFIDSEKPHEVKIQVPEDLKEEKIEPSRTYRLDQVYGPTTDQMTFFQNAAEGICDDFLRGFNCTIFAYGQTGAGKTYTMCGKVRDDSLTPESGIIPRCLKRLFEHETDNLILKCSFVEIYNEVLKDLLSDGKNDKNLSIYEHNKIIKIKSLEEFYIKDFQDAMRTFRIGLNRKKIASTKMNDNSSRSHTIFTIHLMKRKPNGSEFQFAKMNLVDLAGSENIARSGSVNQRAREAGSINQSLLTLGRVINSLVDGSNFIPYRESKLTRLLQDSLGGKTKTILVANIAPTLKDLHASVSTLEYASKAKNIQNSAQIGGSVSEEFVINDLVEENRKLKLDLMATRRRENCIVLDDSNYKEMYLSQQTLKEEVEELRGFRLSLLNQLDNQMRKLEQEKNENMVLSESISNLETKVVECENKIRKQQESELIWRHKCNELYSSYCKQLSSIYESQIDMRAILSSKILTCLVDINSNIEFEKPNHNAMSGISEELRKIFSMIEESSKLDSMLKSSIVNIESTLRELKGDTLNSLGSSKNSISELSAIFNSQFTSNNQFGEFLETFMAEETYLSVIQDSMRERIDAFKEHFTQKLENLITENLHDQHFRIIEKLNTKLKPQKHKWSEDSLRFKVKHDSTADQLDKTLETIQLKSQEHIDKLLSTVRNHNEVQAELTNSILGISQMASPIHGSLDKLNTDLLYRDDQATSTFNYVKENINELENIISDVLNRDNGGLEESKSSGVQKLYDVLDKSLPGTPLKDQTHTPTQKLNTSPLRSNTSIKALARSPLRVKRRTSELGPSKRQK